MTSPSTPQVRTRKVSGHRGFGAGTVNGHRENTPNSILAAAAAGAGWVELDVRRTADGQLVSHHNPELSDGRLIHELSADECQSAGVHLVAELLDVTPSGVAVNLDVKTGIRDTNVAWDDTTGGLLTTLLRSRTPTAPVLVSSFDPSVPANIRADVPHVQTGLLGWLHFPLRKLIPAAKHLRLDAVVFHVGSAFPNDVDGSDYLELTDVADDLAAAKQVGLTTVSYCPTPTQAALLWDAGLDVACVNDIPGAVAAAHDSTSATGTPDRQFRLSYNPDTDDLQATSNLTATQRIGVDSNIDVHVADNGNQLAGFTIHKFSWFVDYYSLWKVVDDNIMGAVSAFQSEAVDRTSGLCSRTFDAPVTRREHQAVQTLVAHGHVFR